MRSSKLGSAVALGALLASAWTGENTAHAGPWPHEHLRHEATLENGDVEQRREAIRALGSLSPSLARPAVMKALRDDDPEVRLTAARTAAAWGYQGLGPIVFEWLKSNDSHERAAAIQVLAGDLTSSALPYLAGALGDAERAVRRLAAWSLGRAPTELSQEATTALFGALDDPEAQVRLEAAASLGRLGSRSAALTLAAHLQDPEVEVREQVAVALGVIGDPSAVPALLVGLSDIEQSVVAAVAMSLGLIGSESAVPGLIALAEAQPYLEPGRQATEALTLVRSTAARDAVLELLSNSAARSVLETALSRGASASDAIVTECLAKSVGPALEACVRVSLARGAAPPAILDAVDQGKLSQERALILLHGHQPARAVVLALEMLSSPSLAQGRSALNYLESLPLLPERSAGPLRRALERAEWSPGDRAQLLRALAQVRGVSDASWIGGYLRATEDPIKEAAAELLVARGAAGKVLRELLFHHESAVARGALRGLGRGSTPQQADELVEILAAGVHGRRNALLSVFWAFPGALSPATTDKLTVILSAARGRQRDPLLVALARSVPAQDLLKLSKNFDTADRIKLAQLAWYHPDGAKIARALVQDHADRVVSLALTGLGFVGNEKDLALLITFADSQKTARPTYVRAAAVQAIVHLAQRGQVKALPSSLMNEQTCDSPHLALRAATWELASAFGEPCAGRELSDVLLRDDDSRMRLFAAQTLVRESRNEGALRRCAFYEPRVEIARACETVVRQVPQPPLSKNELPYQLVGLRSTRRDELLPLSLAPLRLSYSSTSERRSQGLARVSLVSDRSGFLLIPTAAYEFEDESWAY